MGEQTCDSCGTIVPISGKSTSKAMCKICTTHMNNFLKAVEKDEQEFKQMLEKKNNEK